MDVRGGQPHLGEAVSLLQLMIAAGAGWGLPLIGADPPAAGNVFISSRMYTASYGDGPGKAFGAPAAGLRNLKIHGSAAVLLSHAGVIALPGLVNVEHILHATVTLPRSQIGASDELIDTHVWKTVLLQRGRKNATAVSTVARVARPSCTSKRPATSGRTARTGG